MATFIITEIQHVKAVREVEADTREAAWEAFGNGEGRPVGRDGDVVHSELISINQVDAAA
jgi:hypothetical protein